MFEAIVLMPDKAFHGRQEALRSPDGMTLVTAQQFLDHRIFRFGDSARETYYQLSRHSHEAGIEKPVESRAQAQSVRGVSAITLILAPWNDMAPLLATGMHLI